MVERLVGAGVSVLLAIGRGALGRSERMRREARLMAIALIRRRGVVLRNHAMGGIGSPSEFTALQRMFDTWHQEAIGAVTALSPQEGESFRTLDKWTEEDERGVGVVRTYAGENAPLLRAREEVIYMLTAWLRVLDDVRRRYSR